jgi:hypothetical protein
LNSATSIFNTTPTVTGTVASYKWQFQDASPSNSKSPEVTWNTLGKKQVVLEVQLDNGCKSTLTKEVSIGVKPKAAFNAVDVCAGNAVVFQNNSTWPQGDISYKWDFADGTTAATRNPSHLYPSNSTTTYTVTLYASIANGCSDSMSKQITVNEAPRTCDFKVEPDYAYGYYGVKLDPMNNAGVLGGQDGIDYTWTFEWGGTQTTKDLNAATSYNFQEDRTYSVTMRARVRKTSCECTKTMNVVMNRAAVKDLKETGIAVFPNPASDLLNISIVNENGKDVKVTIVNATGAVVKTYSAVNMGLITLDTKDIANGLYVVNIKAGNKEQNRMVNIQH